MGNSLNNSKNKKPWQLIAMLAITLVPMIAAYVAYYTGFGVPEDTVNNGTMIAPAADANAWLDHAAGEKPEFNRLGIWRIYLPVDGECGESCQQNFYTTRQVHIRLAEKSARVERYAVNLAGHAGETLLEQMAADHPGMKHLTVEAELWQEWLANTNVPADLQQTHYYLMVDPAGFAMMYYTADHHGNELLEDIKRILRFSPEE